MKEIRDCFRRKIGMLDERNGYISTRFGSDGFEGTIEIGKSVTISHKGIKTVIRRISLLEYELDSKTIA